MTVVKQALDAAMVNAVMQATSQVMATMADTVIRTKEVKAESDYKASGDISAMICLSDGKGEGMFALSFPLELANLTVARLLGTTPDRVTSDDRCDGMGELVNMVSGSTKSTLSQQNGVVYKLSLPTVIQGRDHTISSRPKNTPYLVVIFEAEGYEFSLQVAFKST